MTSPGTIRAGTSTITGNAIRVGLAALSGRFGRCPMRRSQNLKPLSVKGASRLGR